MFARSWPSASSTLPEREGRDGGGMEGGREREKEEKEEERCVTMTTIDKSSSAAMLPWQHCRQLTSSQTHDGQVHSTACGGDVG